jgi:hypothetical protein
MKYFMTGLFDIFDFLIEVITCACLIVYVGHANSTWKYLPVLFIYLHIQKV